MKSRFICIPMVIYSSIKQLGNSKKSLPMLLEIMLCLSVKAYRASPPTLDWECPPPQRAAGAVPRPCKFYDNYWITLMVRHEQGRQGLYIRRQEGMR